MLVLFPQFAKTRGVLMTLSRHIENAIMSFLSVFYVSSLDVPVVPPIVATIATWMTVGLMVFALYSLLMIRGTVHKMQERDVFIRRSYSLYAFIIVLAVLHVVTPFRRPDKNELEVFSGTYGGIELSRRGRDQCVKLLDDRGGVICVYTLDRRQLEKIAESEMGAHVIAMLDGVYIADATVNGKKVYSYDDYCHVVKSSGVSTAFLTLVVGGAHFFASRRIVSLGSE